MSAHEARPPARVREDSERITNERAQELLDHPYVAHCAGCGTRLHCAFDYVEDHHGTHARAQRDVHDLAADLLGARAILAGRPSPPTDDELDEHWRAGGAWVVTAPTWSDAIRGRGKAEMIARDHRASEGATWVWVPLLNGSPCAWPVVREGATR